MKVNSSWTTGKTCKRQNAAEAQPAWAQQQPQLTVEQRAEALTMLDADQQQTLAKLLTFLEANAQADRAVFDARFRAWVETLTESEQDMMRIWYEVYRQRRGD